MILLLFAAELETFVANRSVWATGEVRLAGWRYDPTTGDKLLLGRSTGLVGNARTCIQRPLKIPGRYLKWCWSGLSQGVEKTSAQEVSLELSFFVGLPRLSRLRGESLFLAGLRWSDFVRGNLAVVSKRRLQF